MLAGDNAWRGSTDAETVRLKRREIADRYRKRFDYAAKLLDELHRLAKHRYGGTLPDNAEGERFAFVIETVGDGRRWKPEAIASSKWLNVSYAEHQTLGVMKIGAFNVPKAERQKLRRERYRPRKRAKERAWRQRQRRAKGMKPREQYEAESVSRTKPWLAAGFRCRRTWERHGKPAPEAVSQVRHAPILSCRDERQTCDTPSQRLARPKHRRHASSTTPRKRQRRMAVRAERRSRLPASPEQAETKERKKGAVRAGGRLSAQAPPQSLASLPAALASPWGPLPWPQTGRVTVSDRAA